MRLLSGTEFKRLFSRVVLPDEVLPATTKDTPNRRHISRNDSISSVMDWVRSRLSLSTLCGCSIRMEAAILRSPSTMGSIRTVIRVFPGRCPCDIGLALSIIMPEWWRSFLITSTACPGEKKCSVSFSIRPSRCVRAMSSQPLTLISSMSGFFSHGVRTEYSAISEKSLSVSVSRVYPATVYPVSYRYFAIYARSSAPLLRSTNACA